MRQEGPSKLGLAQLGCGRDCDVPGQDTEQTVGRQQSEPDFKVIDASGPKATFLEAQPRMVPVGGQVFLGSWFIYV